MIRKDDFVIQVLGKGRKLPPFLKRWERKHSPLAARLSFSAPAHIMRKDVNGKEEWNEWD
ncbi:hypothetical protein B9L19_00235 [Geobacillus thermocatenulatus]|uniref:Uncharacterized protein n=1 Tax=Geobacillus thermocatenulatus TaxID=33938 RepID=A0A226Q976_9BACL|nr:hypothetical protein GT3921_01545 [Geobacillus thermocatenulatus]OXB88594.1 hypothetical protein B9L19_00235 [Geobacillus thermocatenulatus]RAN31218.1 hypothetical protein VC88_00795 [Geobacillus sp. A8]